MGKKTEGPANRPLEYDSPKSRLVFAYFFLDDFFAAFLAGAFFFVAIKLTTFHAVRDLPVAPTWQKTPDCSGKLECEGRVKVGRQLRRPSTFTELWIQFLAIVISVRNMRWLNDIVK